MAGNDVPAPEGESPQPQIERKLSLSKSASTPVVSELSFGRSISDALAKQQQKHWLWRWLLARGANGGIFKNWQTLSIVSVQLFLWFNIQKVSRLFAKAGGATLFPKGRRRPTGNSVADRIVGWLIENGAVVTLCNLRSLLPHPEPIEDDLAQGTVKGNFLRTLGTIVRNIAISITSNLIAEEGAIFLLHLTSTRMYSEVPYFTKQRRSANPVSLGALRDWLRGNSLLQIFGGGLMLGIIESFMPRAAAEEVTKTPFSVAVFLKNFAVFRVLVDVAFYTGHRLMHENAWLYKYVHHRHHEHFTTNLRTNYHFTAPDLFVESALPIFFAVGVLRALGRKMGRFEIHLFMTYVAWHESGTHLGKPLPVISAYPPLSLLYNLVWHADKHNVEFHEVHHNRRHCNYGITQWIDALMGTRRLKAGSAVEQISTG